MHRISSISGLPDEKLEGWPGCAGGRNSLFIRLCPRTDERLRACLAGAEDPQEVWPLVPTSGDLRGGI
jgi:hypothetical protein